MTKKQIERLEMWARVIVHTYNNTDEMISKLKEIDTFIKMFFDMHLIDNYKEVDKITRQIWGAALAEHEKIQAEQIA